MVLKPGGRIAFFVIMAEHLSPEELQRFAEEDIGPDYLDAGPGYATLMASAGFEDVRMEDLTSEYEATTEAWIRERDTEDVELQDLIGADAFKDRQTAQQRSLTAIRNGQLRRYLISAIRP